MLNRIDESSKKVIAKKDSPVVAITFYSKRTDSEPGYHTGILSEGNRQDVVRLKEGLENAAKKREEIPPKVEITLFLIPNWEKGEDYNSPNYIAAKERMIQDAKKFYGNDILIKDFLSCNVSDAELKFLRNCKAMGSVADIVKTRTIIDNQGRPCLQTDSNVTWANNNFDKLYELTFHSNTDAFNSSRCSEVYVSAHNKLVFTGSESKLPEIFAKTLVDYCTEYDSDPWHKDENCNGVYDIAFCEGMSQYGLTYRVRIDDKYKKDKTFDFYPANLDDSRYKLMPLVIACQRESWRVGMPPPKPEVLELTGKLTSDDGKSKPAVEAEINGVKYGYYHFKSLLRVYTNIPSWHAEEERYKYVHQTQDFYKMAEHARNIFVSKQDTLLCMEILARYYNTVKQEYEAGRFQTGKHTLEALSRLIPDTDAGNRLCAELFGCIVKDLHENPVRNALLPIELEHRYQRKFKVEVSPGFLQKVAPNLTGMFPFSFFPSPRPFEHLMTKETLKVIAQSVDSLPKKERQQALDFFKTLSRENLEGIKNESKTAQNAWDEQYGMVSYNSPKKGFQ
ncbi:hypothetical protein DGG96_13465 [Legionella qingyii]|uniref:Uncharacterized protein n=1 Tax=Legionella qingyii TaxID=2184757 RepID=A0A317TZK9_9GAMM|nr:hypothetical protein [Legionella qingyii]PWY55183.1 hypothetical protein DGG96_13465 [Legionella qingyii]RUR25395.1 hypothetical protein ELY20_02765 [Legionella qingyii]RUR28494.1 hypothetical protein ELY16_03245 [Legionella qingyii]